ncbi:MAG: protein translocase subunit SecF [Candidatus Harrisonbacteria bacterium]|nr:protein translocase subunit SecF [Candidatus Harrisonbacteria bacterium]
MNIIKYKYIFIGFSTILTIAAVVGIVFFGFKQGIDFAGGTLWQLRFSSESATLDGLNGFLATQSLEDVLVRQGATPKEFSIRTKEIGEERHQELLRQLNSQFGEMEELSFASIGPAIGYELRNRALLAFFLVLLGISLYIAFAFRKVSYPVSSWKYGFITLVTLFHDALIPAGAFAILGQLRGAEVDTNFIVAILVVMGFSVHDTIVVFDRIRENLLLSKHKENFSEIVNASVNQTFARSVNTSLTLVLVLVALYLFGAHNLSYFTLLILVGTITGTYSSIFVASPLLTFFKPKY